jgi:predicted branched-subunit amino acid permease
VSVRSEVVAGARAVAPMLIGVIPFGLVCGATPAANGVGGGAAVGFSTVVFAGASQLTAIDSLGDGAGALVSILAACTVNLRLLLYSASLAPHVSELRLRTRLLMAYVLTDQAYAVSISRWTAEAAEAAGGGAPEPPVERRLAFYLGAAVLLWANWQVCTVLGIVLGSALPDSLPLDFAVPLVFLVLLVPAITSRPALVAATVGGVVAVGAAELGPAHTEVLFGALAGIAAGAWAEAVRDRRAHRGPVDETPLPPDPEPTL